MTPKSRFRSIAALLATVALVSACASRAIEPPPPVYLPSPEPPPPPAPMPPPPEPEMTQLWVLVEGTGVLQFHYLRSDLYASAGATDAAKLQYIQSSGAYGPRPIGSHVAAHIGETYVFLPECAGRVRMGVSRTVLGGSDQSVSLACPR